MGLVVLVELVALVVEDPVPAEAVMVLAATTVRANLATAVPAADVPRVVAQEPLAMVNVVNGSRAKAAQRVPRATVNVANGSPVRAVLARSASGSLVKVAIVSPLVMASAVSGSLVKAGIVLRVLPVMVSVVSGSLARVVHPIVAHHVMATAAPVRAADMEIVPRRAETVSAMSAPNLLLSSFVPGNCVPFVKSTMTFPLTKMRHSKSSSAVRLTSSRP